MNDMLLAYLATLLALMVVYTLLMKAVGWLLGWFGFYKLHLTQVVFRPRSKHGAGWQLDYRIWGEPTAGDYMYDIFIPDSWNTFEQAEGIFRRGAYYV